MSGSAAFVLSDTYGFPIDLTELMARERGMIVDIPRYKELMEQQRKRSQQSRVRHVVNLFDGCALSVPCHQTGDAPVGLMIAGVQNTDHRILAVGRSIEAVVAPRRG